MILKTKKPWSMQRQLRVTLSEATYELIVRGAAEKRMSLARYARFLIRRGLRSRAPDVDES